MQWNIIARGRRHFILAEDDVNSPDWWLSALSGVERNERRRKRQWKVAISCIHYQPVQDDSIFLDYLVMCFSCSILLLFFILVEM